MQILAKVTSSDDQEGIDSSTMSAVTTSVDTEIGQLKDLKGNIFPICSSIVFPIDCFPLFLVFFARCIKGDFECN